MKITRFDPPGNIDDLAGDAALLDQWSNELSRDFEIAAFSVSRFLANHAGGTSQFYNPVTHGISDTDQVDTVPWNGFPKRFTSPVSDPDYEAAEGANLPVGQNRPQDEYLEWHSVRDDSGKIVSVHFTCEGPDYWSFLARVKPETVLGLYQKFISSLVTKDELFPGGQYDPLNRWNTRDGAMHLTHPANNLFAEVKLAADATVRRKSGGAEPADPRTLINCANFGDDTRNSDPNIGFAVNRLAQAGRMITLANPVGLYIQSFNDAGLSLPDGSPATGCWSVLRGKPGAALRAEFRLPPAAVAKGFTVSDVTIGGVNVKFGGQLAELVTMGLSAASCRAGSVSNPLQPCGAVPQVFPPAPSHAAVRAAAREKSRLGRNGL
jgi:hypothetical protein